MYYSFHTVWSKKWAQFCFVLAIAITKTKERLLAFTPCLKSGKWFFNTGWLEK